MVQADRNIPALDKAQRPDRQNALEEDAAQVPGIVIIDIKCPRHDQQQNCQQGNKRCRTEFPIPFHKNMIGMNEQEPNQQQQCRDFQQSTQQEKEGGPPKRGCFSMGIVLPEMKGPDQGKAEGRGICQEFVGLKHQRGSGEQQDDSGESPEIAVQLSFHQFKEV